ncbi:hypothetical protein AB1Y20_009083 [Prymnesium parvum]|uniref:Uncharacterized protein n=1 Tax=Prymnesium parvum TaxID=97485 RepID=A0AB34K3C1_PRYPA
MARLEALEALAGGGAEGSGVAEIRSAEKVELRMLRNSLRAALETERGYERYKAVIEQTVHQRSSALVESMHDERRAGLKLHDPNRGYSSVKMKSPRTSGRTATRYLRRTRQSENVSPFPAAEAFRIEQMPNTAAAATYTCEAESAAAIGPLVDKVDLVFVAHSSDRLAKDNELLRNEIEEELHALRAIDIEVHALQVIREEKRAAALQDLERAHHHHASLKRAEKRIVTDAEECSREIAALEADLNEIRREVQALRSRGQGDGAHLTGNRGYAAN